MESAVLTKALLWALTSRIQLSTCHPNCVKDTAKLSVQNETYALPQIWSFLMSTSGNSPCLHSAVKTGKLLLITCFLFTPCQSLWSPGNFASKYLLTVPPSRWLCCPESSVLLLVCLFILISITFCHNNGEDLLSGLSHPVVPLQTLFHVSATHCHFYKSQNGSCLLPAPCSPMAFYCSQDPSPTFLCIHLPSHKALAFALYLPCVACHLPLFPSKLIFIGKQITPVPRPMHAWGYISVKEKE